MRRSYKVLVLLCMLLLGSTATVLAKAEQRFETGTCGGGTAWWTVTFYEDGVPVRIEGVDCYGNTFVRFPNCQVLTTDPTVGMTATHTGSCDNGAISPGWFSVIEYDAGHVPNWMGGMNCNGSYWVATTFEDQFGPDGELQ